MADLSLLPGAVNLSRCRRKSTRECAGSTLFILPFLFSPRHSARDEDKAAAAAVNRRTLTNYVRLPNYQQYWIEAGFEEEMPAIRQAIAQKEEDKIPQLMSDCWLQQVTLYGTAIEVREGIEAWYDAGVNTLIVVPSSAQGNQMAALEELIAAFH
jgi:alkanesulfonate monooxygenase SsuD/methylene tetrahydromethanopterin reductase-like flavin-dependent oxidoreductase (luciferase family)